MIHITTNTHEKPGDEILEGHGGLKKKGKNADGGTIYACSGCHAEICVHEGKPDEE